jgi:two-component system, chemotaxis family, protein-glutamate methylesterase/glutaminase
VATHDIIVMGASAGGLETYKKILSNLPPDIQAAMFIVLHSGTDSPGRLARLLERGSEIPVNTATDNEKIEMGMAYVAPPDFHMTFRGEFLSVQRGPKENRYRPSIDTTFRSAARNFGPRVIGVLLTGLLDDGALGLRLVKEAGGVTIIQDPDDALFNSMPLAALELLRPDQLLPAREIGSCLLELSTEKTETEKTTRNVSPAPTRQEAPMTPEMTPDGKQSEFTCPECHGALWEKGIQPTTFECRIGHRFSLASLVEENEEDVETAMWVALRTLEESAALSRRMAERARTRGYPTASLKYTDAADNKLLHADTIRRILTADLPKSNPEDFLAEQTEGFQSDSAAD